MPAIKPDNGGAPEAKAMPRHKGSATRKTTTEAGRSRRIDENMGKQAVAEHIGLIEERNWKG
jgi:hypothetical protein